MEPKYRKRGGHNKPQQHTTPGDLHIQKSTEAGFDLKNCMDDFKMPSQTYEKNSDYYFDSYSHFGIHEDMLKDRNRTLAYKNAIMNNPQIFKDKIVMDVGCGTGILSIFAAKAGAKHVYGIEFASIANHAKEIIKDNGLSDKITVIRGKVEEVTLPVDKVDIIISEWMGYFLLYESMFDSCIYARDKWLQPDGMMFPNRAIIYVAALEDGKYKNQKIGYWDDVYGVRMSSIKKWSLFEPLVDTVQQDLINTDYCPILDIDLKTVKASELDFASEYRLTVNRDDKIHGLVAWFDTYFSHSPVPVKLSTSPYIRPTHWKQTLFYFNDVLTVKKGDVLKGCIAVKKAKVNPRELDIKLSYHIKNQYHVEGINETQFYRLS